MPFLIIAIGVLFGPDFSECDRAQRAAQEAALQLPTAQQRDEACMIAILAGRECRRAKTAEYLKRPLWRRMFEIVEN